MGNAYSDYLSALRGTFREGLNPYLEKAGLPAVSRFLDSPYMIESGDMSLALYPSSPKGETLSQDGRTATVYCTVELFVDDRVDTDSFRKAEELYYALIAFIDSNRFSEFDVVDTSLILRTDAGDPCNGALLLIKSRLSTYLDSWD